MSLLAQSHATVIPETARGPAAALMLAVLTCIAPSTGAAQDTATVKILHFTDLRGEVTPLTCARDSFASRDLSSFVARLDRERSSGLSITVGSGNVLGDTPSATFLLDQGESGLLTLSALLARTGADLFLPALAEFSLPYRGFAEAWPLLEQNAAHFRVANVTCTQEDACPLPESPGITVVERSGVRIAFVPLASPAIGSVVHPGNIEGLSFRDPAELASVEAARIRTEGAADLVLAITALDIEEGSSVETLRFARNAEGIDGIIAGGLSVDGHAVFDHVDSGPGRPFVVASPKAPDTLGVLTLHLVKSGRRWRIDRFDTATRPVDSLRRTEEVSTVLSQLVSEFCSLADMPLGKGRIDPPMDAAMLSRYTMEIMRRFAECDVALLSVDSVRLDKGDRLSGVPDQGFVRRAYAKHEVVVLTVEGADLAAFAASWLDGPQSARDRLLMAGINRDPDGVLLVNDRQISTNRRYRVATTDFLASGGRSLLAGLLASPYTGREGSGFFLAELAVRHFRENRYRDSGASSIALESNFSPLWDLPLWELLFKVNAGFNSTSISNAGSYSETQLARAEYLGFTSDAQATVNRSTRDHGFSDFTRLQYAMAGAGQGASIEETQDLVTEELTYSWLAVRNRWGDQSPLVPVPILRSKIESEFSRAQDAPYHHLEATGVAGIQWLFGLRANAGLGYGFRTEMLDPADPLHPGAELHYAITSLPLYQGYGTRSVVLDSRFELFYSDWSTQDILKASGSTRLSVTVWSPLALTLGFDAFLFRSGGSDLAWSLDTLVGLTLSHEAAFQSF